MISVKDVISIAVFSQIFDNEEEWNEINFFDYMDRLDEKNWFLNTPISHLLG